jgi:aldose 1-epimerase
MTTVSIKDPNGSTAKISVSRGFNLFEFKANVAGETVNVIDSQPGFETGEGRVSGNGIPVLFPFPNRIKGGKFSWDGVDYEMPSDLVGFDGTGNAIHGFCLDRAWRVVDQGDDYVVGEFQLSVDAPERLSLWPADCRIQLRYELAGSTLRTMIEVYNPDTKPLPWGFGTHPYFTLPLGQDSQATECLVYAPAKSRWQLVDCLPTGIKEELPSGLDMSDGINFGTQKLDDVFSDVPSDIVECSIVDERAGLQVVQRSPGHYPELVIYTPPNRDAICFEPYTCVTDAINLQPQGIETGWNVLPADESWSSWIEITASQIQA